MLQKGQKKINFHRLIDCTEAQFDDSSIETNTEYSGIVELRLVNDAENPESDPALRVNDCPKTLMALADGKIF